MSVFADEFLPPPQTEEELRRGVTASVTAEIAAEVDPLQARTGTLAGRREAAIAQLGGLFDKIQPSVAGAATQVEQAYQGAQQTQRGIFDAAMTRIANTRSQRATEAQALAQQIGGPVPVEEFTAGYDIETMIAPELLAGQQLHTLGMAQAGVQEAQAFSGRVFPMLRTEQTQQTRRYYDEQIAELNTQIDSIKQQKGTRVDAKLQERLLQERQYALDRAVANRNYIIEKERLKQTDKDLKLKRDSLAEERRQFEVSSGIERRKLNLDVKKYLRGIAVENKQLTLAEKEFRLDRKRLGLDETKAKNDLRVALENIANNKAQLVNERDRLALERAGLIGEVFNPRTGKYETTLASRQLDQENRRLDLQQRGLDLQQTELDYTTAGSTAQYTGVYVHPVTGKVTVTLDSQRLKYEKEKLALARKTEEMSARGSALELIEAGLKGESKTVVTTRVQQIGAEAAAVLQATGKVDDLVIYPGPDKRYGTEDDTFGVIQPVKQHVSSGGRYDEPAEAYKMLIAAEFTYEEAVRAIKTHPAFANRVGADWKPPKPGTPQYARFGVPKPKTTKPKPKEKLGPEVPEGYAERQGARVQGERNQAAAESHTQRMAEAQEQAELAKEPAVAESEIEGYGTYKRWTQGGVKYWSTLRGTYRRQPDGTWKKIKR